MNHGASQSSSAAELVSASFFAPVARAPRPEARRPPAPPALFPSAMLMPRLFLCHARTSMRHASRLIVVPCRSPLPRSPPSSPVARATLRGKESACDGQARLRSTSLQGSSFLRRHAARPGDRAATGWRSPARAKGAAAAPRRAMLRRATDRRRLPVVVEAAPTPVDPEPVAVAQLLLRHQVRRPLSSGGARSGRSPGMPRVAAAARPHWRACASIREAVRGLVATSSRCQISRSTYATTAEIDARPR